MEKKEIYKKYVSKIKIALENDNFETLDAFLEALSISEKLQETIWDLIYEVTLYLEYKIPEYKEEALAIIEEDFGDLKNN